MTEIRNVEQELRRFRLRVAAALLLMGVGFVLLGWRLVVLQVVRHDELLARAESNRTAVLPIVPDRGRILDRNGLVLASNYTAYTLELTPSKVGDVEATIDALAQVLPIDARDRRRFARLREDSKRFESIPLRNRLTDEEVARFAAQRFRFPGVEIKARLFRSYPYGELGSHLLGYIGRINQAEKEAMEDWPEEDLANYRGTDSIGKLGLEQSYETQLHGTTGFELVETSAGGRAVRRLGSQPAVPGAALVLSVDMRLQALVEQLYGSRRGALVALDPRSGEVLAFVSKPTFDPNLFVDGIDTESWKALNESLDKPLLNRALRGTYPPGSTYKPFMSLAALTSGKRAASTVVADNLTFTYGGRTFGSPETDRPGPKDMRAAIVHSSNVYFYTLAVEMGVDLIHDQMLPLGFGRRTGIDLRGEAKGLLPSTEWKRGAYKTPERQRWYAGETVSLGIGQGYNSFTMLQIASAMATVASGGQRHEPRLVRQTIDPVTRQREPVPPHSLTPLPLRPDDVAVILDAMHGVTVSGTSARVFAGAPYASGGKTGTAQAVGMRSGQRYSASGTAERLRDHSLYVAFAPRENPTIALALIVENAGWGSTAAAPIARRVFDYWVAGLYPTDEDIAAVSAGRAGAPIRPPVPIAQATNIRVAATLTPPEDAASAAGGAASGAAPNGTASAAAASPAGQGEPADANNPAEPPFSPAPAPGSEPAAGLAPLVPSRAASAASPPRPLAAPAR